MQSFGRGKPSPGALYRTRMAEYIGSLTRGANRMSERMIKIFLAGGILLCMVACSADRNATLKDADSPRAPTYSTNGSYDDNGVEPPPNNGNQNFGFRGQ